MTRKIRVLGAMSGSSLDGLDIAICEFTYSSQTAEGLEAWTFLDGMTEDYSDEWINRLKNATQLNGRELTKLNTEYGHYSGKLIADYIQYNGGEPEIVASHGHSVFHFPEEGFTLQIGAAPAIATEVELPVIADFRSRDVACGGQGAPIVPIAEKYLWPDFDLFLNIGGIANLSYRNNGLFLAGDVCVANQVLNYLAKQKGVPYDNEGKLAYLGTLNQDLFDKLNANKYYSSSFPKSLDNSFSVEQVIPILDSSEDSVENKLCTFCHHIGYQVSRMVENLIDPSSQTNLLTTGGGAFNDFLIYCIKEYLKKSKASGVEVVIPAPEIIGYKEAIMIAWMGLLRWWDQPNVLSSVTGAKYDTIGGVISF